MKDQELLAKTHALCERLHEIMQHNFDCRIQNTREVPEVDFVTDRYG